MIGTLVALLVAALFLKLSVRLVGGAGVANTFGTAFIVAAIVALVGHVIELAGGGLALRIIYMVSWLFVVKTFYAIGWVRAAAVGVVLVLVLTAVKVALVALGVASLGALALLL